MNYELPNCDLYKTHRGSRFNRCVDLSYFKQEMREMSPLKKASPISIVVNL
jgi:hypothetical protein